MLEEIKKSLKKAVGLLDEEIKVEHPAEFSHGDYSTNLALVLAKKKGENPKKLAEEILTKWQKSGLPDLVKKVEVAPPGFLNIWIKFDYLVKQVERVLREREDFGKGIWGKGKTMVIDFSSPNIAKRFGVGHLRSTNIGQALYNLYAFSGWKVIGDNHLGDWGTQFGTLIWQIEKEVNDLKVDKNQYLQKLTVEELERLYIKFHQEAKERPELEEKARECFKRLEEGESEARKIWQVCVEISLKEFEKIYKLLGTKFDVVLGESFYQDKMKEVLAECKSKGLLKESQGALVVEVPGVKTPAILVKSDGATTYLLRDLATIKYRRETWNPDLFVYEVGADQALHFVQLFKISTQLGYGRLTDFVHVSHGLIGFSEGKFSTREGKTIHLEEVLNEAIERAKKLCLEAGVSKNLSGEEREKVAQVVGIGAVKYNDLKQNPKTDIIFDWEQVLSLQGNSGPYLQYTYARTQNVLAKAKKVEFENLSAGDLTEEEKGLLRTIYRFSEAVEKAAREFSPNLLCNFLFDLSQKFNLFYDRNRILRQNSASPQSLKQEVENQDDRGRLGWEEDGELSEEKSLFRLALTAAVGQVLKNGLKILGIEVLEKM